MGNIDDKYKSAPETEASDQIFTLANLITFIRLLLVPVAFVLMMKGQDVWATVLLIVTASTDFLDGMIARKTNTVTKLGQFLDPLVDRVLILTVILGLLIMGRLPLWIAIVAIIRDAYLIGGGVYLAKKHAIRIPVSYLGKTCMWFLCVGLVGLVLNMPVIAGLGICDVSWLPGFSTDMYCPFIWIVYIGLVMSLVATGIYTVRGHKALAAKKAAEIEA